MAQSDYNIGANPSGLAMRTEINTIFDSILTHNSGSTAPTVTSAFMMWVDTSNATYYYLKMRNHDNTAWVTLFIYTVSTKVITPFIINSPTTNALAKINADGTLKNSGIIADDNGNLTINSGALRGSHGGGNIASNFAAGDGALQNNTTGIQNTANGVSALVSNTTGSYNTANGVSALYNNTTGIQNTANGVSALYNNTTGIQNTANGVSALQSNTTGSYNTATGVNALYANTTGTYNTANGASALVNNTTGYNNTANGANALTSNTTFSNVSGFGYNSQVTGSNQIQLGDSATTTYVYGTVQNRSDLRDKADVRDTVLGLDFIKSLRPVDYKWDMREDYKTERPVAPDIEKPSEDDIEALAEYNRIQDEYKLEVEKWLEDNKLENIVKDGSKKRARYHQGFIAQEVQALGVEFGGIQDHLIKGGEDVLSIGYDEIIAPLVKAIQEMSIKMDTMQLKIDELEGTK